LGEDLEPSQHVQAAFGLSQKIKELEAAGFWVFAGREVQRLEGGVCPPTDWPVAIVRVVRARNPEIIHVGATEGAGEKDESRKRCDA
jgi:hypothetical protein